MRKQREHPIYKDNQKRCTHCKIFKDFSDFHKMTKSPDGYQHQCRVCTSSYNHNRTDNFRIFPKKIQGDKIHCRTCKEYLDDSRFTDRKTNCIECVKVYDFTRSIRRYGFSPEQYTSLLKSQNGVCKICGEPENGKRRLSLDHDHSCCPRKKSCGKCVRGLLCVKCNAVLGYVNDDKTILQKMLDYLDLQTS